MNIQRMHERGLLLLPNRQQNELIELLETIDALPTYLGASEFGADEQPIIAIANFIIKYYPSFGKKELIEAVEMSAAGLLTDGNKVVRVTTFGKPLNIDMLGVVLSAYRDQQKAKPQRFGNRIGAAPVERPTAEWHYDRMMAEVKATGTLPTFHAFTIIHKHMVEAGLIPDLPAPAPVVKRRMSFAASKLSTLSDALRNDRHRCAIQEYLTTKKLLK
jgi:hypothetical protein